jgi:hypothetical protein
MVLLTVLSIADLSMQIRLVYVLLSESSTTTPAWSR